MTGTLLLAAILPSLVFASKYNISSVGIQGCSSIGCHGPSSDNGTLCYFDATNYVARYNVHSLGIAENALKVDDLNMSFTLTNGVPEFGENNMTSYNQSLFLGSESTFSPRGGDWIACAIMLRLADDRPFPDEERQNSTACEGTAVTEGMLDVMAHAARDHKAAAYKSKQPCQDLADIIAKNYSSSNAQYSEIHAKDIRATGGAFMGENTTKPISSGGADRSTQTCFPVLPERTNNDWLLYFLASQPVRLPGGKQQLKETDRHLGMTPVMTVIYSPDNGTSLINFMCLKASESSVGGVVRPSAMVTLLLSVLSVFAITCII